MFCAHCGCRLAPGAAFCHGCGARAGVRPRALATTGSPASAGVDAAPRADGGADARRPVAIPVQRRGPEPVPAQIPAPIAAPPGPAAGHPAPGARRGRSVLRTVVATLLLAVGIVVAWDALMVTAFSPGSVVGRYLGAIEAGDAQAALALVASPPPAAQRALLTREVMGTGLHVQRVTRVQTGRDWATVTVEETVAGQPRAAAYRTTYRLARSGLAYGVFPRWRLVDPFTHARFGVTGGAPGAALSVNGVPVPAGEYALFAGSYRVRVAPAGAFGAAESTVIATGSGYRSAQLAPALDPRVRQAAAAAVGTFLDSCARSPLGQPPGCPFAYGEHPLDYVHWSITNYPQVSVTAAPGGTLLVSSTYEGTAHLTAVDPAPGDGLPAVDVDETFGVTGVLSWDGGDPSTAAFSPETAP